MYQVEGARSWRVYFRKKVFFFLSIFYLFSYVSYAFANVNIHLDISSKFSDRLNFFRNTYHSYNYFIEVTSEIHKIDFLYTVFLLKYSSEDFSLLFTYELSQFNSGHTLTLH